MAAPAMRFGPPLFSCSAMIAFIATAAVFAAKASETQNSKVECSNCWYQQQIGITAIMALMVPITCSLCLMYIKANKRP